MGAALALAAMLGGCSTAENASAGVGNAFAGLGERLGAPWGGTRPSSTEAGATIDRVRGTAGPPEPLQVESGNVWPEAEAPRATLANPDAALRNIPAYRPGELDRMSAPAGRSVWQPTDPPPVRPAPADINLAPSPPPPVVNPPPRAEGRVYQTPRGAMVGNGGTDRMQTVIGADGRVGTAIRDGNTTTILTPGGGVEVVPTPR